MYRILLVDDESGVLAALVRLLRLSPLVVRGRAAKARVDAYSSPHEALAQAEGHAYDLVVSDYRMPGMDGVALLKRMRALQPDCARIILSGYADLNGLIAAINEARIERFVAKPWHDFELVATLGQALENRALRMENEALADLKRCERAEMSPVELEMKRLEQQEPGITQVQWDADGSIVIDLGELEPEPPRHGG